MHKALNTYKELKQRLINNTIIIGKNKSDEDYMRLLKLKDISSDVKETLLLLHSNYRAELKELQTEINTITLNHIDNTIDVVTELHARVDALETKLKEYEEKDNKDMILGIISVTTLQKLGYLVGGLIVLFFILYVIEKEALDAIYNYIKDLLGVVGLGKSNTTS